ncbi:LWamide neuropeptides-like [Macrobrachium rosenbergii]|uniref:LWamide neuropeptides-like n=1 Tax=Macrobrachium rosenbergii TaxID=79674 RepID=UPI0034D398E6
MDSGWGPLEVHWSWKMESGNTKEKPQLWPRPEDGQRLGDRWKFTGHGRWKLETQKRRMQLWPRLEDGQRLGGRWKFTGHGRWNLETQKRRTQLWPKPVEGQQLGGLEDGFWQHKREARNCGQGLRVDSSWGAAGSSLAMEDGTWKHKRRSPVAEASGGQQLGGLEDGFWPEDGQQLGPLEVHWHGRWNLQLWPRPEDGQQLGGRWKFTGHGRWNLETQKRSPQLWPRPADGQRLGGCWKFTGPGRWKLETQKRSPQLWLRPADGQLHNSRF